MVWWLTLAVCGQALWPVHSFVSTPVISGPSVSAWSRDSCCARASGGRLCAASLPTSLQSDDDDELEAFRGPPLDLALLTAADIEALQVPDIRAVATDVDGTFLTSQNTVSGRTMRALVTAYEQGIAVFPATGKSRAGAYAALGAAGDVIQEAGGRGKWGVFLQGGLVYGPQQNGKDVIVHESVLDYSVISPVLRLVLSRPNAHLIAYSGDRIVCEQTNEIIDSITRYHEPQPEALGDWNRVVQERMPIHKLLIMAPRQQIDWMRPNLKGRVNQRGLVTQALPDMLEVLPLDTSKGKGVMALMAHMKMDPMALLAMGDAENDLEMLEEAGVSVVMDNAKPFVKEYGDFIAPSNDKDGAAIALEKLCKLRFPEARWR